MRKHTFQPELNTENFQGEDFFKRQNEYLMNKTAKIMIKQEEQFL